MDAINGDCPIECLAPILTRQTLTALVNGIDGSLATVGRVIELYAQHRLMEISGISTGRYGEIKRGLIEAKLIEASSQTGINRRCIRDTPVPYRHHPTCPGHLGQSDGRTHAIIRDQEAPSARAPARMDRSSARGPA